MKSGVFEGDQRIIDVPLSKDCWFWGGTSF